MGWVQDYSGLLATRFFLGVTEAGLFPGVTYLCSTWYCRYELQFRIALFYCAASLAGSFSGLLAYGIGFMDGKITFDKFVYMILTDKYFFIRD
jgi:MFS family permease